MTQMLKHPHQFSAFDYCKETSPPPRNGWKRKQHESCWKAKGRALDYSRVECVEFDTAPGRLNAGPVLKLHSQRLAQKLVALAQHLSAGVRVFQVVIQVIPGDQLDRRADRVESCGHALRLLNVHIRIQSAVKQEYRRFDPGGLLDRRAFVHVRPIADEVALQAEVGPVAMLFPERRQVGYGG